MTREPCFCFLAGKVLTPQALEAIKTDFPTINSTGVFPVEDLGAGPSFAMLIEELRSRPFTELTERKLEIPLQEKPPAEAAFDGKRETNNSTRVFFSPPVQQSYPVCREVASAFKNSRVISAIEDATGAKLENGQLRIEYCQDTDGFWLEPHVVIRVKKFTMLIYLSDDARLSNAGTDIYNESPEHRIVATASYEFNAGTIFIPGKNTWHGFRKRPIRGIRKSIIVNYVSPEWRATAGLA